MRFFTSVVALILCISFASAQRPGGHGGGQRGNWAEQGGDPPIVGKVMDENGEPVPYASIAVYQDSALIAGGASNEEGRFRIPIKPGTYWVKISFLSLEDKIVRDVVVGTEKPTMIGRITLVAGSTTLNEFTVDAEKSTMELKLDKRVFNVGKDLSNQGANASEILDNVPSVTVDVEGNVSLRGSENVRILIDGKPSGLTGMSTADALRQLDGNMIDRIEIITNPSARYDAEGEAGIINIILKKDVRKGINGTISLNAGHPATLGGSFNLNYRREKMNLFASAGLRYRDSPGGGKGFSQWTLTDTAYSFDNERIQRRTSISNNFRVGSDFFLNKYNTLTFAGLYRVSDGTNYTDVTYHDFNENGDLTQTVTREEVEDEQDETQQISASYRKTFDNKERVLKADFSYSNSDEIEVAEITELTDDARVESLFQRASTTEDQGNIRIQTDYVHPVGEDGKFEIGGRSNMRTISNNFKAEELNTDEEWEDIPGFVNDLAYTEKIHAAYVMYGNKIGKFSYQGGLRGEYSDITTDLKLTNEVNHRTYLNLFPSGHFSYEIKENRSVQLSYSRRVRRPRFWSLLPFFNYSDPRNIYSGNPNLDPEYTDSYEMGYLVQGKKGTLLSSVYYRHVTGVIERILLNDTTGLTRRFPTNLGTRDSYGLEFSGNYDLMPWWSFNGSVNLYKSITEGEYEGQDFSAETYTWNGRISTKWKIKKKLNVQTSFRYRAPQTTTQGSSLAMYNWDAGASVDCLKGKGTLSFSARDILNTRKRRSIIESKNFYSESEFQYRMRSLILTFSYRINQKKRRGRSGGEGSGGDFDGGGDM